MEKHKEKQHVVCEKWRESFLYGIDRTKHLRLLWIAVLTLGICYQAGAQINVTGTVSESSGEPIPGVNVIVEGSTTGTTTDTNGEFRLSVPSDTSVLIFSFIGYETQRIRIGSRRIISVSMIESAISMDEVIITAFSGKQTKESVTSSITTVRPSDLKVPSSNLTTSFAGRIAGMISYQRSGEPGVDNADFFIRGVTTFGYKKDPLILVDGIELGQSDLARLQVDDIASFSILKDAAAAALYGARGANGVILITTKEGREGKAVVNFRFENSLSRPTRKIELADPITNMLMHNEAFYTRDPTGIAPHDPEKIANTKAGLNPYVFPAVDWYGSLFREVTNNQRANMSINGGGSVARYYVAATYTRDQGNLKTDSKNNFSNNISIHRYLLRANVNVDVTRSTEVIVRLHGTMDDYTGPIPGGQAIYERVMRTSPVLYPPYYLPDRQYAHADYILFGNYTDARYVNPYADMVRGYKDQKQSLMLAQFEVKQGLDFVTPGLRFRAMFNTNRRSTMEIYRYTNPFYFSVGSWNPATDEYRLMLWNPAGSDRGGVDYLQSSDRGRTVGTTTDFESQLDYNRVFSDKHDVEGMLVFIMRDDLSASSSTDPQMTLPGRNMGLSGRATYVYDKRYSTEFNFGYNGSERFAKKQRWGFFPSMGVAWNINNEPFWNGNISKIINKLKLKATYGLVGNDAIGDSSSRFFYLSNVNLNNSTYSYGWGFAPGGPTINGVSVNRYANDAITWEVSRKTNIGMDVTLFKDLEIQADLFSDYRTRILMERASVPTTLGLQANLSANLGEALSKGVDVSLNYQKSISADWWASLIANFTYATSVFKKYEEPDYSSEPWRSRVGRSTSQQWGYVAERLFVDDNEVFNSPQQVIGGEVRGGDLKYVDINKDGIINSSDQVPIGYPTNPEIVYGFGISSGYKNFDFSCFFQGLARESFWLEDTNSSRSISPFANTGSLTDVVDGSSLIGVNQVLKVIADSYWSEENPNIYAFWPRLSIDRLPNNYARNTWFMRDGSFLRLKTVEVGYSLPEQFARKLGMSSLRLYYSGNNLMVFSKFKLWDPEMAGNGLGYPVQQVHNFGLHLTF
jgi:TonB-linked SusC/RagA family outer membrane protein